MLSDVLVDWGEYHIYMKWDRMIPYEGAIPIRQDVTVLPADNPRGLRLGWIIYEDIGLVVMNDEAINRVNLSSSVYMCRLLKGVEGDWGRWL